MPTPSSDLVTVRREGAGEYLVNPETVFNLAISALLAEDRKILAQELMDVSRVALAALTQSDVGRTTKEDVQGSIATKQEACPETALRTELPLLDEFKARPRGFLGHQNLSRESEIYDYIVELHDWLWKFVHAVNPGASGDLNYCAPRALAALRQLTKTPSADHDAGNLRSLAEPPQSVQTGGGGK